MSSTSYCARHSDTETNLRCGKCEALICPRCLVHGPVGIRCPECAGETRLPTFDVTWPFLARAMAAGLGLSIAGGIIAGLLRQSFPLGLIESLLIVGLAYVIGEGISLAVNRKRGRSLKYVAAGGVLVSFFIVMIAGSGVLELFDLLALAAAFYVATSRF
jgi:hypothetical protein